VKASESSRDESGEIDSEKQRQERLAILNKYDGALGSVQDVITKLATDASAAESFFKDCPYKLDDLLVSKESWPFSEISELSERFGPLPKGYRYRYLAPESRAVPAAVANNANNVIRIPSSVDDVLTDDWQRPGDEVPDGTLGKLLSKQSAALNRLWTMRHLVDLCIVSSDDTGEGKRAPRSVPLVGSKPSPRTAPSDAIKDPRVANLVKKFEEQSLSQYDAADKDNKAAVSACVVEKRSIFKTLGEIGPNAFLALGTLLDHRDVGVRVSAATYLLPQAPQTALPILRQVTALWPGNSKKKHESVAIYHAQHAIWMYEDGNLKF
jgi:hypothetical protein